MEKLLINYKWTKPSSLSYLDDEQSTEKVCIWNR